MNNAYFRLEIKDKIKYNYKSFECKEYKFIIHTIKDNKIGKEFCSTTTSLLINLVIRLLKAYKF